MNYIAMAILVVVLSGSFTYIWEGVIKKQFELNGMSYLIDFTGLNFIFQLLLNEIHNLELYNNSNNFNYQKYILERKINNMLIVTFIFAAFGYVLFSFMKEES